MRFYCRIRMQPLFSVREAKTKRILNDKKLMAETKWVVSTRHTNQLEWASTGQRWDNWHIKKDDSHWFKYIKSPSPWIYSGLIRCSPPSIPKTGCEQLLVSTIRSCNSLLWKLINKCKTKKTYTAFLFKFILWWPNNWWWTIHPLKNPN